MTTTSLVELDDNTVVESEHTQGDPNYVSFCAWLHCTAPYSFLIVGKTAGEPKNSSNCTTKSK